MAVSSKEKKIDASTEDKIKQAARVVFTMNGYAATKVRDIAAEAGINFSLVNYYFRSKEKLFQIVMAEVVEQLVIDISGFLNNESTTVFEKLESIASYYIDLLIKNPDLPLFVVSEVMLGAELAPAKVVLHSHFSKQLAELAATQKPGIHPFHLLMNLMGLIVMPFLGRAIVLKSGVLTEKAFIGMMEERKKLIPAWVSVMVNG